MRRALLLVAALAGCHRIDPAYRREVDMVCSSPGTFNGRLRLRTSSGKALGRALDGAAPEAQPFVLLRAASDAGLARCGGVSTKLAMRAAPSASFESEGVALVRYDEHDAHQLALDPELSWRKARGRLDTAGDGAALVLAHGNELRALPIAPERPIEDDLGLTVALTGDALVIYATADANGAQPGGAIEGSPRYPRLRITAGLDGYDAAVIERVLAQIDEATASRLQYQTPSYAVHRLRWIAADTLRLTDVTQALTAVRPPAGDDGPVPIVIGAEPPTAVPSTTEVRIVEVLGDLGTPAPPAVAAKVEGEYAAELLRCWRPQAVAGTAELHAVILMEGTMRQDPTVRTFGLPEVDRCLQHASLAWQFPPQERATELVVRLTMGL